jgi:hypothetical protein
MRALVVYESMYGNTHAIATDIAAGLRETHEVVIVPVAMATADLVAGADLLVVGGPTHMHGLSTASSRELAAKSAAKPGSGLMLEPHVAGPGLRDWLDGLADRHAAPAAAFDTRVTGMPALTGRASHGIRKLLLRHGYFLIAPPESFLVSQRSTGPMRHDGPRQDRDAHGRPTHRDGGGASGSAASGGDPGPSGFPGSGVRARPGRRHRPRRAGARLPSGRARGRDRAAGPGHRGNRRRRFGEAGASQLG